MNTALLTISLIWEVHDCLPEFHKKLSLTWLSEENDYHVSGRAVLNGPVSLYDLVRDRKVATVKMLGPFGRGFKQLGLDKGIGYINNGNILSFCSINGSSKHDGFQNRSWAESSNIDSSHQVCLDIGFTVEKMGLRCTPVFSRQQVWLVQWLKGITKIQLTKLLEDCI